jgi:hypothetical protein
VLQERNSYETRKAIEGNCERRERFSRDRDLLGLEVLSLNLGEIGDCLDIFSFSAKGC